MEATKSYLLKVVKSIIVIGTLLAYLVLVQIIKRGSLVEGENVLPILFLIIYLLSIRFEVKFCRHISLAGMIISVIIIILNFLPIYSLFLYR